MSKPHVEVVVDHWRRPKNVGRLLRALRAQTVPCRVTLVNVSPGAEFLEEWRGLMDRVVVMPNYGSQTRFAPIGLFDCEFTYWHDNDMEPGRRCIEHLLASAELAGNFAVLGQFGRKWPQTGNYKAREIHRSSGLTQVDFVVRSYFIRSRHLHWMEAFRWQAGYQTPFHDDLLASMAIQHFTGLPSVLTVLDSDPETRVNFRELPSPHSLCADWNRHIQRRTAFVRQGIAAGWRSLLGKQNCIST